MGMPVSIHVRDPVPTRPLDAAFAWLRFVDATFSPYRTGSEVARIADGRLAEAEASPLVREVLARCEALGSDTGGFFDARAGGRLDPSGFVKGWAVDHVAKLLAAAGARRFCVNAGGDLLVRGGGWRVGIRHPRLPRMIACVVELDDGAVATSGGYERGAHVIDPFSGRPPRGVASVTIVGSELGRADAYATAAFAMGERGPHFTASLREHDAMTILAGDRVLSTRGFLARCPGGSPAASLSSSGSQ